MSASETYRSRAFYRSADRAVLGGVCAGISDYFGFNLKVLRAMAVIAFVCAMPMTVIAYLAVVFLIPARSGTRNEHYERPARKEKMCRRDRRRARKQARREAEQKAQAAPSEAAAVVRSKCQSLDERLATLEKYITSSRYQLDQEFRKL
ncbi:MAG: PspC domain-containing protein [Woeseiaceae bacterium]